MTLLQISYALACAKCSSLTKAAELLGISVSNVSKTIKSLEDELEYTLFQRTSSGMVPTERGRRFLFHAASIHEDYQRILEIGSKPADNVLSICCNQVTSCMPVFTQLCRQHQGDDAFSLSMQQGSFGFCLEQLKRYKCHMAVVGLMPVNVAAHLAEARQYGMRVQKIGESYTALLLREGHPLLGDSAWGSAVNIGGLNRYPYINYAFDDFQDETLSPFQVGMETWPVNPNKIIVVNNMLQKLELVRSTDGYTFGQTHCEYPTPSSAWPGIVEIPNTEQSFQHYLIYPEREHLSDIACQFVRILREELLNK